MKILSALAASNFAVCLIKWLEGNMRKKLGMLTVNMRGFWNCEDTEPKAYNRNGEQNKSDRTE